MVLPVKLHDVIEATECSGPELSHYLDKRTGEVLMITDEQMRQPKKISYCLIMQNGNETES